MPRTEEIIALESRFGSLNYTPLPIVLERGEGVFLWDVEGKKYFDFISGFSAVGQGHCHPRIVRVLQEQAAKLTLLSRVLYSDQFGPFAQLATKLFGFERILTMNTGAEAFETGTKLARKWGHEKKGIPAGKARIVTCNDCFHGRTLGAVAAMSNAKHHEVFGPTLDGFDRIPYGDLAALEKALENPHVAAFLVEPVQGEAGVIVPPEGYLRQAFELCQKRGVLFIADEIQTGIGRSGRLLACHYENFRPDVVLLGKSLSGGTFPVSAVLADEPLMAALQPGDHGSTFGGSPLACAVAQESLKVVVEEKLVENSAARGEQFRAGARAFKSPLVKEVRGKGLLNAIELVPEADVKAGQRFCDKLRESGLLAKPTRPHVLRFAPPLVITEAQMAQALSLIGAALAAV